MSDHTTGEHQRSDYLNFSNQRVLIVMPNVPFPIVSGGHMRDAQILAALNKNGIRPFVLYFSAGEGYVLDSAAAATYSFSHIEFGGARCERPDSSFLHTFVRKVGYVAARIPKTHPFAYQYDGIAAGDIILEYAQRMQITVIILRSFWCHYGPKLRKAGFNVIANCPDYNPILAREMVRSVNRLTRKLGPICNAYGVRRIEEHFLPECDEVWVPTESEAMAMSHVVDRQRMLVMPNMIDVTAYPDLSGEVTQDDTLLFVGNFSYLPNANAARLVVKTIFPAIRKHKPKAKLLLVGSGLPADLLQAASKCSGAEVRGFVEDLIPVYRQSCVVLLPVREGAGMLFKALEALSIGKPTIGFRQAFRGIPDDSHAYVTVDSPSEMCEATLAVLSNPVRRRELGQHARSLALKHLSWNVAAEIVRRSCVLNGRNTLSGN